MSTIFGKSYGIRQIQIDFKLKLKLNLFVIFLDNLFKNMFCFKLQTKVNGEKLNY